MKSDPIRSDEQLGLLLQPFFGPFTFRTAAEPRDPGMLKNNTMESEEPLAASDITDSVSIPVSSL